jgi:DNA-binding FadR family transcriptional regulator
MHVDAARLACLRMTEPSLTALRHAVDCVATMPAKPAWARKAAAHAKVFRLVADVSADMPGDKAARNRFIGEVIRIVGPAADWMLTSSHHRLLQHIEAGDADGAEQEAERLLRVLHIMWRLAGSGGRPSTAACRARSHTQASHAG